MSILQIPEWLQLDWLEHGFGTKQSEGWTQRPGRSWAKQTHSATVLDVHQPGLAGEGDALLSETPGLLLEIRTADCLPVLLIDTNRRVVAAVHAGWRGVATEILPATVRRMLEQGSLTENLEVAIGPGIGKCCFEVGPEVSPQFGLSGRVHIDLKALIREQLRRAGTREEKIFRIDLCTKCDQDRFHSFRRDREAAGRMTSAIARTR